MASLAVAAATAAVSGAVGAYGSLEQANAASNAAKYNSQVADINATQAARNATMAAQAGEVQVANQQQKTRAEVGAMEANQAASGVDVNSGSAVDTRASASELGELDALTIRSNAAKEAYGYQVQQTGFENESTLDTFEQKSDKEAGYVNAGSSLLSGASSAASNWQKFQMAGGIGGGS